MFARGITLRGPSSAERGAVNLPVVVGGGLVTPGDLVIGDGDGLVALTPAVVRNRIGDAEAKLARRPNGRRASRVGVRCSTPSACLPPGRTAF